MRWGDVRGSEQSIHESKTNATIDHAECSLGVGSMPFSLTSDQCADVANSPSTQIPHIELLDARRP